MSWSTEIHFFRNLCCDRYPDDHYGAWKRKYLDENFASLSKDGEWRNRLWELGKYHLDWYRANNTRVLLLPTSENNQTCIKSPTPECKRSAGDEFIAGIDCSQSHPCPINHNALLQIHVVDEQKTETIGDLKSKLKLNRHQFSLKENKILIQLGLQHRLEIVLPRRLPSSNELWSESSVALAMHDFWEHGS